MHVRRTLAGVPAAALLLLSFRPLASAGASVSRAEAMRSGAAYVTAHQTSSGAFFDAATPADAVAEAVASLVAAGVPGSAAAIGRAMQFVERNAPDRARAPAYAGRVVMGAVASGRDPRQLGGVDYVARITAGYNAATGAYENGVYAHALAVLGLIAAREPVPEGAKRYLRINECSGGGFAHDPGCVQRADLDTTAVSICALGGVVGDATRRWFANARNEGGGWGLYAEDATNANSTGLALSAMACMGDRNDAGAAAALMALRLSSGGFRYIASQENVNDYATVQALPGLAGSPYPVRPGSSRIPPPVRGAAGGGATHSGNAQGVLPNATPCPSPSARPATGERHAGLVVQFASGEVVERCVRFSAEEERAGFTGVDLLRRSGLPVVFGGTRAAASICRIGDDGCNGDGGQCFCECSNANDASCRFWGYYTMSRAGAWQFMQIGASIRRVRDGDVDGWRYANHSKATPPGVTRRPCDTPGAANAADVRVVGKESRGWGIGMVATAGLIAAAFVAGSVRTIRRRRTSPEPVQ